MGAGGAHLVHLAIGFVGNLAGVAKVGIKPTIAT